MEIFIIVLSSLVALALIFYIIIASVGAYNFVKQAAWPNFDTREKRKARNKKEGISKGTEKWAREEFTLTMKDGYVIHGDMTINDPKKVVMLMHGHSSTREGVLKYAKVFHEFGYSVVMYDHRGHGDNEKTYVSMGYREAKDAAEMLSFLRKKFGNDAKLGVFGVSMGGATALIMTQYTQDMDFIVCDCPYDSLEEMLKPACKAHKAWWPLPMLFTKIRMKIKYGFSFKDVRTRDFARAIRVPVLLIMGDKDTKVAVNSQKLIQKNLHCYNDSLIVPNAGHGKSVEVDPDGYKNKVNDFLNHVYSLQNERNN